MPKKKIQPKPGNLIFKAKEKTAMAMRVKDCILPSVVAKEFNCSVMTVYRACLDNGVTQHIRIHFLKEKTLKILLAFLNAEENESVSTIADRCGCTRQRAGEVLKQALLLEIDEYAPTLKLWRQ